MVELRPETIFQLVFTLLFIAGGLCMNATTYYLDLAQWLLIRLTDADMFLIQSVVTCGALFWLLHRAWLTLWKPVPELISILGVEVPEPPAVSLAGIKADSITLQWTRPEANKLVLKYLIQVNGVNVGETTRSETSITVTGLKPAHFYNVRVIAVGGNNFQAGSRVIRLRTFNREGRPELGTGSLAADETANGTTAESSDDSIAVKCRGVAIEPAMQDGMAALIRDGQSRAGSRRNTVARRHSPSNASENPPLLHASAEIPEGSMAELTERFEAIRREIDDVIIQTGKDAEDTKVQMAELSKERDEKRMLLKQKEEASEKLKKEVNASERINRQAQMRKTAKEKVLKEKMGEREKMLADMKRWESDIREMREERKEWEKEKNKLAAETNEKVVEMRTTLRKRQNSLGAMEEEIRVKGLQIKEMEEERKKLPGAEGDNEDSKAAEAQDRARDAAWEIRERELMTRYNSNSIVLRNLEAEMHKAQAYLQQLSARQPTNPLMFHGNTSAAALSAEYDISSQPRPKQRRNRQRKSRTNTLSSSNLPVYPTVTEQPMNAYPHANPYTMNLQQNPSPTPTFAPGPYFDPNLNSSISSPDHTGMTEAEIKAFSAGAPLSPTATSLLPSNIFADDDPPEPRTFGPSFQSMNFGSSFGSSRPQVPGMYDNISINDPRYSPDSSSRSASLISSPQASQYNLSLFGPSGQRDSYHENDRHLIGSRHSAGGAFGVIGSPSSDNVPLDQNTHGLTNSLTTKRFGDLFSFTGTKARSKTLVGDGPSLGSLKNGQSRSYPKQVEEPAEHPLATAIKNRRTSFTTGWDKLPFLNRGSPSSALPGSIPESLNIGGSVTPSAGGLQGMTAAARRRGFNMFGSPIDDPTAGGMMVDRSPGSPRPASIASSDLPRPSTDSAPFGWAPSNDLNVLNRNSPLATNWSLNVGSGMQTSSWGSRVSSRRPSIQQPISGLREGIASDDLDFLPDDVLDSPSTSVGVIGTRPVSRPASEMSGKKMDLNPAAPTFKAISQSVSARFRKDKGEKDKETNGDKAGKAEKPAKKSKKERRAERDLDASRPRTEDEAEEFMTGSYGSHGHTSLFDTSYDSFNDRPQESRDGQSIKTLNSVTESYDSLENAMTSSDHGLYASMSHKSEHAAPSSAAGSLPRTENSFQKLLRKGSSSKFSIAGFRSMGGKKGTGNVSASASANGNGNGNGNGAERERSQSLERGSGGDEGGWEGSREDLTPVQMPSGSPLIPVGGEPGKGKEALVGKEGRMSVNWGRFAMKKKEKEKGRAEEEAERGAGGAGVGVGVGVERNGALGGETDEEGSER